MLRHTSGDGKDVDIENDIVSVETNFFNQDLVSSLANSDFIEFLWTSSDEDNNISGYDFYLGTSIDNLSKLGDKIPQTSFNQQLILNTNYFWQVITIDLQGNNSASGINQFQTEP